ncbi:MAG TPA: DegT/DnrJ/EryC1/StrS family aminotransferase [Candidatus Macondimonas sp.]|nr:DegT/DnrJ/EryC1/StrS family aminotransferase [Candidatus Macondimonas sp.]
MRERFLTFGAPLIGEAEIAEVVDSLRSGWLGTGPKTARFERDFAAYRGVDQAVAVNSCTAALHLSLLAAGLGPGDEVITTPLTFCATVNAILHAGATPVLADVDPVTFNLDPAAVAARITPRTRAILPVHFAGRPCDMGALMALAERHDLRVIEDCAHAIESTYDGQGVGTFGDFGCFSFYVTKNVVTGEGGMILARRAEDAARLKTLALHGMSHDAWKRFSDSGYRHYQVVECGFKYNMMDLQAAIGLHQLARVEASWQRRRAIWARYQDAFADLPVTRPAESDPRSRHAHHLYTLLVDEARCGRTRDAFLEHMTAQRIGVGVHYLSLPEHPYYQDRLGWRPEDNPNAMRIGRQTVSLPLSPALTDTDVEDVIAAVRGGILA